MLECLTLKHFNPWRWFMSSLGITLFPRDILASTEKITDGFCALARTIGTFHTAFTGHITCSWRLAQAELCFVFCQQWWNPLSYAPEHFLKQHWRHTLYVVSWTVNSSFYITFPSKLKMVLPFLKLFVFEKGHLFLAHISFGPTKSA